MRGSSSLVLGGKTLIFQDCKIESPMNNSEALAVTDFVCRHWQHPQKMRNCGADKPSKLNSPKTPFAQTPGLLSGWFVVVTSSSPPGLDVAL